MEGKHQKMSTRNDIDGEIFGPRGQTHLVHDERLPSILLDQGVQRYKHCKAKLGHWGETLIGID